MKSTNNYMSPEDFQTVINTIPSLGIRKWDNQDIQMLFKILYWCGLRFNEGLTLSYSDIDLENHQITLGKTKTEKYGIAIIGDPILDELSEWLTEKGPGPLFPGLSYDTAIRWIYRMGTMLKIQAWIIPEKISGEKTKSHIFRKSIAKDMLSGTHGKATSINVISQQLRHKDLKTTEDYLKVTNEAVRDYWEDQRKENQNKDENQ